MKNESFGKWCLTLITGLIFSITIFTKVMAFYYSDEEDHGWILFEFNKDIRKECIL